MFADGMGYLAVCSFVLGYAALIWWLFEKRTEDFKGWAGKLLKISRKGA